MKELKQEAIDQAAHATAALLVVMLAHPVTWYGGLIIGLAMGITREVTEDGPILSAGSLRDLAGWAVGGAIGGALFALN